MQTLSFLDVAIYEGLVFMNVVVFAIMTLTMCLTSAVI